MTALPVEALALRRPVGMLRNRRPGERRDGGGTPDDYTPDYDPQQHAADAGQLVCPHGSCTADGCAVGGAACSGGCPVTGGALNSPDAKHCDQCGGSLYSEDGTIIVNSDGVPEEIEGGDLMAQAFARNKAELELRRRQLELLGVPG